MQILDQLHALDAATAFVKKQMSKSDMMAIMQYTGTGVDVLQDFTDDKDKLLTIIATLVAGEADNSGEANADASAADTGAAFGQDDSEFNIFNTDRQLAALETATKMLGTLNEKKSLIYFASGMQLNGVDNQAQLRATDQRCDTRRGFRSGRLTRAASWQHRRWAMPPRARRAVRGCTPGAAAMARADEFRESQDTLYTLASDTGGKAMLDYNDLGQGIVNAEKAITSYYIIGYYTTNDNLDGKFRRVKITLNEECRSQARLPSGLLRQQGMGKFTRRIRKGSWQMR